MHSVSYTSNRDWLLIVIIIFILSLYNGPKLTYTFYKTSEHISVLLQNVAHFTICPVIFLMPRVVLQNMYDIIDLTFETVNN